MMSIKCVTHLFDYNRNLQGYRIAKLYYGCCEYELARRYVSGYLTAVSDSAQGHRLLGECLEKLNRPDAALRSYRTSLELNLSQKDLLLKICELMASSDTPLDQSKALYWCEQAQRYYPNHPTIFSLRERIVMSDKDASTDEVEKLILNELEQCPMDVGLRIRLLQHLLRSNKIPDAYKHAYDIEQLKYNIFTENLTWYETVGEILHQYHQDNRDDSHEFWIFYIAVLDKITSLQLEEQSVTSIVQCKNSIFNLDQKLKEAVEGGVRSTAERNLLQEFTIHYHGQLCLHLATLHFKIAKIDKVSFKEASRLNIPLLLGAWSSPPAETTAGWLNQSTESTRKWMKRWNLEANFRTSQAGHVLLSILGEHPTNFSDKLSQICSGNWRERLFKSLFVTREQVAKIKSSYFITCPQLDDLRAVVPSPIELGVYDATAQLYRPSSLHHVTWLVLTNKFYEFHCNIFNGLQYSTNNLNNCAAETLNCLDIQAFIYCAAACARVVYRETSSGGGSLVLPVSITENVCTPTQENWYRAAYKVYKNTCGDQLGSLRLTLTNGIEVIRCVGNHGLSVNLLVLLAKTFSEHEKLVKDVMKKEFISTRATLYWKTAIPLLERLRNNQTIRYAKNTLFNYRDKELGVTEINQHLEDGKLYLACKLREQQDYEKALEMFQGLKSPYATFYQAQIYKTLAAQQVEQHKENVTSQMRSQHIIFLSKARDCFYLTLDRLKEPSMDRKHPLNCDLATEIENIESMLSRIDPDICQNECESDENISSVGSMGDHIQASLNYTTNGGGGRNRRSNNLHSTPFRPTATHHHQQQQQHHVLDYNNDTTIRRTEARPSPERLEAQIRQMSVTKDTFVTHFLEQNRHMLEQNRLIRTLSEEIRNLKEEVRNELTTIKETLADQIPMIKKEMNELKKDVKQQKTNNVQLNDEDLYDVLEGIDHENDYNIQAAIQAASSAFNQSPLYSGAGGGFNKQQKQQQPPPAVTATFNYPSTAAMYPTMFPPKMYQPGAPLVQPVVSSPSIYKTPSKTTGAGGVEDDVEEDVYEDEEYDYSIHAAAAASNAFSQSLAYSTGLTPRHYPTAVAAAAAMFPGMYPHTMYGYHPALSALPYAESPQLPTINLNPGQLGGAPLVQAPVVAPIPTNSNNLVNKTPPVNVVITASDPVPTTVTTSQSVLLSVTIPPQHLKGNIPKVTSTSSATQPHSYQISLPLPLPGATSFTTTSSSLQPASTPVMPVTTNNLLSNVAAPIFTSLITTDSKLFGGVQASSPAAPGAALTPLESKFKTSETSGEDANKSNVSITSLDEQDPCPDFKPIIPLPDEIVVKTGEEDEQVLFKERAKLFRYVDREWKERGVGDVKLLHDTKSSKVRLLMRRDQIHKICANHYITSTMSLSTMSTSDRAYMWAAHDFADEEVRLEKLCIRFKTPEQAKNFYDAFENAKKLVQDTTTTTSSPAAATPPVVTTVSTTTASSASLGGFTFSSTPIFEPKKVEVISKKEDKPPGGVIETTQAKPSPFAGFSFKSPSTTDFAPLRKPNIDPTTTSQTSTEVKGYFSPKDPNLQPLSVIPSSVVNVNTTPKSTAPRDAEDDEFVPTAEFNPVIPLPDLVEVKTGEEDEQVLFCERAKLFRYDAESKQWKERGLGDMKILKSGIVRLLMRREQVLKICCNHQVTKVMKFMKAPTNEKLVSWGAQDYSENQFKNELFQIRFKTADIATRFIVTLEEVQKEMDSGNFIEEVTTSNSANVVESSATTTTSSSWGDQFKPKAGQWECKGCYITNNPDVLHCIACDAPKDDTVPKKEKNVFAVDPSAPKFTFGIPPTTNTTPGPDKFTFGTPKTDTSSSWGDQFKPPAGSWSCKSCYISNDASSLQCIACGSQKDGGPAPAPSALGGSNNTPSKFTFGIPETESTSTTSSSWGNQFKPPAGSWSCKSCYISNDASALQCIACGSQKDGTPGPASSVLGGSDTPSKFTFGIPPSSTTTTPSSFKFGGTPTTTTAASSATTTPKFSFKDDKKDDSFNFQFNKSTQLFGGAPVVLEDKSKEAVKKYTFGSPDKFDFVFTPRSPRKSSGGGGEESDGDVGGEDDGEHIHFTPIIPLPEKIEVKTGEEDEDVLYCHRAKLFIFVSGEWKERGLGDVKVLRHQRTGKLRVVMRRDQVLKICLNHVLNKDVEYIVKDDKSWLFSVNDYSDGQQLEHHQFCIRFKTSDIAQQFITAIHNATAAATQQSTTTTIQQHQGEQKTPPPSTEDDGDDVEVVLPQLPAKLIKKAKDLMLPELFYTYLDKAPCPGCIGCDPDSYQFTTTQTKQQQQQVEVEVEVEENKPKELSFSFSKAFNSLSPTSSPAGAADTTKLKSIFGGSPSSSSNTTSSSKDQEQEAEADASTQVKSIFGNAKPTFGSANFSFGKSSLSSAAAPGGGGALDTPGGGNNIFNNTIPVTTNIFSGKNTTPTPATTGSSLKSSLFGGQPNITTPTSTTTPASIFGGLNASKNLFGTTSEAGSESKSSIFGGTAIFGGASNNSFTTTPSTFGGGVGVTSSTTNVFNLPAKANEPQVTKQEEQQTTAPPAVPAPAFGLKSDSQLLDFSALAQTSNKQSIFTDQSKTFQFEGAGTPVFKNLPMKSSTTTTTSKSTTNDDDDHQEVVQQDDDGYDPHYEPIIALPEQIQVSTGEEDEEKLFCQRAKLFRYDTQLKEWKERGVGEMKILHHPQRHTYRFILRREQVHKLVLNQLLRADMQLKKLNKADNAFCWGGYNHCGGDGDDAGVIEEFAIRFKNQQLAEQFYNTVMKCQEELKALPAAQIPLSVEEKTNNYNQDEGGDDDDDEEWDDDEEEEEDEEVDDDDYNDEDDDDEYDKSVIWEKHCKLYMGMGVGVNDGFNLMGDGEIQIICDTTTYENRIFFANEHGEVLTNTRVSPSITMQQNENVCTWTAVEDVIKDNVKVTLRCEFDTIDDAQEFYESFQESTTTTT